MTTAGATLLESAPASGSERRRGRFLEFLLVGGATPILFPLAWFCRAALGLDASELAVGFLTFHAAHVVNDPHFSVTYLLFYRDVKNRAFGGAFVPQQRVRYLVAGFFVPLVLAVWITLAFVKQSAMALGLLMELMFLLVGWHYAKQGFGVLTVLWARRGTRFTALERRVLLAHCYAGWALAWANPAGPSRAVEEKGLVYVSFPHPPALELVAGTAFLTSAVVLAWILGRKWKTERRLPPLVPLGGFLITVWLWTVFTSLDPLMVYVIPALHSVQYLYFVWLLKRNEARAEEGPPNFGKPATVRLGALAVSALALGWVLFHGAPELFDGLRAMNMKQASTISALGPTPYFAALFAFVNIHHYFMDHVIWRREHPETRFLQC